MSWQPRRPFDRVRAYLRAADDEAPSWPRLADKVIILGAVWTALEVIRVAREVLGDLVSWLRWLRYMMGLGVALVVIGVGADAQGAACTPGTDCYSDCVQVTTGTFKNAACETKFGVGVPGDATALLLVEDFEAPTLRLSTGVGDGAPYYGPWFDDGIGNTGVPNCNRGDNSYFVRKYGNGVNGVIWPVGSPSAPTFGCTCNGAFSFCTGLLVWDLTNRWNANSLNAPAVIMTQASDFSAEVGTIAAPTGGAGGGTGVFDGNASFANRVPTGRGSTTGNLTGGSPVWGGRRNVGITMAAAYPNNSETSGIWAAAWKHDEWGPNGDGIFMFWNQNGAPSQRPFVNFMFFNNGGLPDNPNPTCVAILAAATKTLGDFNCTDVTIQFRPDLTKAQINGVDVAPYARATDWVHGTWGCPRAFFENMGLSNARLRIWLTPSSGPRAGQELAIIDISNLDMSSTTFWPVAAAGGLTSYTFDQYANTNGTVEECPSCVPTTEVTFRYSDNIHIRAGSPVACSQIGFTGEGGPPPDTGPASPGRGRRLRGLIVSGALLILSIGVTAYARQVTG